MRSSFPRSMFMRLFRKLFTMSPVIAPDARRKPRGSVISIRLSAVRSQLVWICIWRYAASVPASMPENVPRHVFPLPNIGFLSVNLLLKSIGVFPLTITGVGFAMYAGSMNHSACIIERRISFRVSPFCFFKLFFVCISFLAYIILTGLYVCRFLVFSHLYDIFRLLFWRWMHFGLSAALFFALSTILSVLIFIF